SASGDPLPRPWVIGAGRLPRRSGTGGPTYDAACRPAPGGGGGRHRSAAAGGDRGDAGRRRSAGPRNCRALPGRRRRAALAGASATRGRGAGPLRQRSARGVCGRVLLVGDAGGYVDALTGEGIALGLAQARSAVAAILVDRPAGYERSWRQITWRYRLLTTS